MKQILTQALLVTLTAACARAADPQPLDGRVDLDIQPAVAGAVLARTDGTAPAARIQWEFAVTDAWSSQSLRFTPSHDCTVRLRLKSRFEGMDKPHWVLYDGVAAEGAAVRNGDFETPPTSKTGWIMEQQVKGQGAAWLNASGLAQAGTGCIRVWHNGPATQQGIALKAGREVTLTLQVRKSPEMPAAADPAEAARFAPFDFSYAALQAKHPEIRLADRIVAAMRDVPPLPLQTGERDGLPAAWLNGEWQFLPMPALLPEAIARNRLFVPSLLTTSFAVQEAYAPAPQAWYQAEKAWYAVNVDLPAAWREGPLVLRFGAVDFLGAVFINGRHAATHAGRYTPFEVPLTASDTANGRVNLAVFVLKCPYAINDGVSLFQLGSSYRMEPPPGGICAPVCLVRDTPVALRRVRITTTLNPHTLAVACETGAQPAGVAIEPVVVDADGRDVFALPRQPVTSAMGWSVPWKDPRLWSHEQPYLYRLRFDLYRGDARLGPSPSQTFGFREVKVRGREILINDVPVKLFGVSVGQQSNAAFCRSDEDFSYRFFRILKDKFHINALRFHHTPAFEAQIRAADRAGMLVINQSGVWTSGRDLNYRGGDETLRNLEREFGEWIWRDMNSPATIIWDTANEYIAGSPGFADYWRKFDEIARRLDPTRIVEQSASGPFDDRGATYHLHTGYYSNARAHRDLPSRVEKPVIFGEFLSPKDLEVPRGVFDEQAFNDTYIKTFEDRLSEYRLAGAAGIFPFYSIEDAFTLDPVVPEGQAFEPSSFHPRKLADSYIVNPYRDVDAQIDPRFTAMTDRVFAPVAALWRERSHSFEAGRGGRRTLRVSNDSQTDVDATVTVALGGRELHRAQCALKPGEARDIEVAIPPDAASGRLVAQVAYGTATYVNDQPCSVVAPAKPDGARVLVHGGTPALEAALIQLGYQVERLADLTAYDDGVLVVGENAVTEPGKLQTVLDRKRGSVVVLRQDGTEFSEFLGMDYISADGSRTGAGRFARAGLYAPAYDSVLCARGVADYDSPAGTDAAYLDTYAVPMHSGLTPPNVSIVFSGARPHHVPCLRYALSAGNYLFCQMPLESHFADDGRARPILQRLVELAREPRAAFADGAIYSDHAGTREALAAYGFQTTDDPVAARLAIVSHASYAQDKRLASARQVLVYAAASGEIDGRKLKVTPVTGFTTFLVSPTTPGLSELSAANFFRIVDGTINKEGGFKYPVPVIGLPGSERAVFGKKTQTRMRVFAQRGALTVMAHYVQADGNRWVCGFEAGEGYVLATALSIARWLQLPFALETPRRVQDYYVVGAGDVTLDGDLTEWQFDGDQTLHNWRRAMALRFGEGDASCTLHAMEDTANLYLAVTAAKEQVLTFRFGAAELRLVPNADGSVQAQVDGRVAAGGGKWRRDGARVAIEAAMPHTELNLGSKTQVRAAYGTVSYPPADGTFSFRMKQPRYGGDFPAGVVTGSGETRLEVHVGQATSSVVVVQHPLFDKATRVTITESPGKGWKIQLVTRNDRHPVRKGDLLLAVVYARCAAPDGHLVTSIRLGQTQDQIADVPIDIRGGEWRRFYARARANKDYALNGGVISLSLGSAAPGTYEFANLQIVNFGAAGDAEGVPASSP